MDLAKMADVIQERHGTKLDPADPIFLLATVAAELNKESREEFQRMAAELSDQVSTALVLADTAARARSERLITEAAKWSSDQIRTAGNGVVQEIETSLAQSQQAARAAVISAWVAGTLAVAGLAIATLTLWL
jgi:hypothetical protein